MTDKTLSTKSKQDYVTPRSFLDKVCEIWPCYFDLAASDKNHRFPDYFTEKNDSFKADWASIKVPYFWLNPPFANVTPWLKKCVEESKKGARIVCLTKAERGTKWYREYVRPYALSLILGKRLTFEGEQYPFTKDLMINVYGNGIVGEGYFDF